MNDTIDMDAAWTAFEARDRSADGRFIVAVRTTGIYCKPSCPARHPRRENVTFYTDPVRARAAGFRACLRCRPDEEGRDRIAVARAIALMEAAENTPGLEALAAAVGYAPHHFHRLFKRATGITPAAYARALKAERAAAALSDGATITQAIYDAGYSAPSRFYAHGAPRLGMTPSAWARGGAGVTIRWTLAPTSLGPVLIAATERGICRIAFDTDGDSLRARFPAAKIVPGDEALGALAAEVVSIVESPGRDHDLPLDVRGTAFQEAIWKALRTIPPGETRSYAELAALAGRPGAVRAAGTACGANHLPVLIPCHRVTRTGGAIGGYAFGHERKLMLLDRERDQAG
ncbi:bifunctional DNA-binding transcriptional regulator/O6-methylguanine-DNA methyltransferase Ada [Sphingomonas mucosissima]|uniref:methylated-DNA--[protein]-cysteine S-methyltransferase n=1 Tax=Sphingomonas mucosissima TaxID=370959 RepID=A0A245ZTL4_9SPHN|nr:bifunctional DNA-binding transcriptional regulator/O6-methylguanine-DNA methyltransferase Ada [Sphingomonas mucosissima]OWK33050.1 bifunctional transcriptional activator/DNA repair enzyme Ada [Sphingomonas mucosissima]